MGSAGGMQKGDRVCMWQETCGALGAAANGKRMRGGRGGGHCCISVHKGAGEGGYLLRAYLTSEVMKTKRNESLASTYVECTALDCSVSLEYRTLHRSVKNARVDVRGQKDGAEKEAGE